MIFSLQARRIDGSTNGGSPATAAENIGQYGMISLPNDPDLIEWRQEAKADRGMSDGEGVTRHLHQRSF